MMKLGKAFVLLVIGAIAATSFASTTAPLLQNPGFEQPDPANSNLPSRWSKTTDGTIYSLDSGVRHEGERSMLIMRKPDTRFGGVAQSVAAQTLVGKSMLLRARLKGSDIGKGDVGVWLRATDDDGKNLSFAHSYATPVTGSTDWLTRQAIMIVPQGTTRLTAGAAIAADGKLWVDSAELVEVTLADLPPPSTIAKTYLDEVIGKVRTQALNRSKVDWQIVVREAHFMISGAQTTAETYPAVRHILRSLQDSHSHMTLPSAVESRLKNAASDDFNLTSAFLSGKGYVSVPGYVGVNPARMRAFADELNSRIANLAANKPCGWIVDLRENDGGGMYPMIAGLVSLLADDQPQTILGHFVSSETKLPWLIANGEAQSGNARVGVSNFSGPVDNGKAYVAVLTGPRTASSGEAVVVSFRERANTRSFGEATRGLSTGNESVALSDGAMLHITSVVFADRKGTIYGGKIEPDVKIASATKSMPLANDPTVKAAMEWLDESSGCRKP